MFSATVTADGRSAHIGELYNADKNEFYKISVIETNQLPDEILTKLDYSRFDYRYNETSTFLDNSNLNAKKKSNELSGIIVRKCSIIYKREGKEERIGLCRYEPLRKYVNLEVFNSYPEATHIVFGIQWGVFVSCKYEYEDEPECSKKVETKTKKISKVTSFELTGDLDIDKTKPTFEEIAEFTSDIHRRIQELNGGKGNPIKYTV